MIKDINTCQLEFNANQINNKMKKVFFNVFMVAALALPFVSCDKDHDPETEQPGGGGNTGGEDPGEETTFNFFDPADCDEDGWLWLDSQAKIDKYVGSLQSGKKILLVDAEYEAEDEDFPGITNPVPSTADPSIQGYNKNGVKGGEGSRTGGLVLPVAICGDWWDDMGGGFLVSMPDCFLIEVCMSQAEPDVYTELHGAVTQTTNPSDCRYIWDYGYDYTIFEWVPLSDEYVAFDDLTNPEYSYTYGGNIEDPVEVVYTIAGKKGCGGRTAYYMNDGEDAELIIHGLRVFTYTDTNK